jgi:hypothetical protein
MDGVLAIGPKIRGFKPERGGCILRVIKIRSTPSVGDEVKPSASCKFYGMLKNPSKYETDISWAKFIISS